MDSVSETKTQAPTAISCGAVARADALRARVESGVIKRHSDTALYKILADVLSICEMGDDQQDELRAALAKLPLPHGKQRRYIEKGSDIYQVACRYVFNGDRNAANTNRYAISLRMAAERQVRSGDLVSWLTSNGGINELYLSRPLDRDDVKTACLRLAQQITVKKGEPFTLRLVRLSNNSYDVLEVRQ